MIRERHPHVAERLAASLEGHPDTPCLSEAAAAARSLRGDLGFEPPSWPAVATGQQAPDPRHENQRITSPGGSGQVGSARRRHVLRDISVMSRFSHRWRLLGEPLCSLRADLEQDCLSRVAPPVLPRRSALNSSGFCSFDGLVCLSL